MVVVVSTYHDLVRSDVFSMLPLFAGRLLDVGGGVGATSAALKTAGRASEAIVVDHVEHERALGIDKTFVGDLEDLALIDGVIAESGTFDTILCLDVLEHLRDPWMIVRRLHYALREGGSLVISLPNVNHLSVVAPLVLRGKFELVDSGILDRTHLRWFTRSSAIDLATCSGLVLEAIQSNIYSRAHRLANRLTLGLFSRFFAVQYVIHVRRRQP